MANTELLERVMQFIKDNPRKHDQSVWCGTSQCFAGWAVSMAGWQVHDEFNELVTKDGQVRDVERVAREALGLTTLESYMLFGGGNTVEQIELMVKDLANGETLDRPERYFKEGTEMLKIRRALIAELNGLS